MSETEKIEKTESKKSIKPPESSVDKDRRNSGLNQDSGFIKNLEDQGKDDPSQLRIENELKEEMGLIVLNLNQQFYI